MWNDDQLNSAKYVSFVDGETLQDYNLGTIEITTGSTQGIYLMRPAPPFGSLSESQVSGGVGVYLGAKQLSIQYQPRSFPVAAGVAQEGQFVIHDYGKPNL